MYQIDFTTPIHIHFIGIGGISIPNYCLSLILIGIFSVTLRLLPSTGMYTSGDYTFSSLIQHLILPAIAAGAILVTNNTREFERVPGLNLEDWVK